MFCVWLLSSSVSVWRVVVQMAKSPSMRVIYGAGEQFLQSMDSAAAERNMTVQLCAGNVPELLKSLTLPTMTQVHAMSLCSILLNFAYLCVSEACGLYKRVFTTMCTHGQPHRNRNRNRNPNAMHLLRHGPLSIMHGICRMNPCLRVTIGRQQTLDGSSGQREWVCQKVRFVCSVESVVCVCV